MPTTTVTPESQTLEINRPFLLESGFSLEDITIQYHTYGTLNPDKSNIVWVFHALTGNSNPIEWWDGFIDEESPINPNEHYIICSNMLGSCYGTTGPENGNFPLITIRDIVGVQKILRDHLGINKVWLGIGGSMGGQQLLDWAVQEPDFFENIVPIATNAVHSPWGIAFNEAQRMALDNIDKGKGLEAARAIAMLSYRGYHTFEGTQKDTDQRWDDFSASSYLKYQGEKLRKRFTSNTYLTLSKAMDSHNVGRHHISIPEALDRITSKALVVGISSDLLFPVAEQEFLNLHLRESKLHVIESLYGHDGFLTETQELRSVLGEFLQTTGV